MQLSIVRDILLESKFDLVNKDAMAELSVGLELLKSVSYSQRQELYYWQREARGIRTSLENFSRYEKADVVPVYICNLCPPACRYAGHAGSGSQNLIVLFYYAVLRSSGIFLKSIDILVEYTNCIYLCGIKSKL